MEKKKKHGYMCRKHRVQFLGSYCTLCYKERRNKEKEQNNPNML